MLDLKHEIKSIECKAFVYRSENICVYITLFLLHDYIYIHNMKTRFLAVSGQLDGRRRLPSRRRLVANGAAPIYIITYFIQLNLT